MAPELWPGGTADARSDIYALGSDHFLLTAAPPFRGDTTTICLKLTPVKNPNLLQCDAELSCRRTLKK
jgi:serine/threonine protein kinase